jgi:hypothetical protein
MVPLQRRYGSGHPFTLFAGCAAPPVARFFAIRLYRTNLPGVFMPRFVEDIVNARQKAGERRKQELDFQPLGELAKRFYAKDASLTAQILLEGFHAAAQEVRSKVPQARPGCIFEMVDDDLENFVLSLEEWTVTSVEKCPDIFDEFDEALERLYDWADANGWSVKV